MIGAPSTWRNRLIVTFALVGSTALGKDEERLPYDVRMPVRGGAGYSWAFDDGVADLSFSGAFTGFELARGVRPELLVGIDGLVPGTVPVTLPDETGKITRYGFARGHLAVEMGLGLRFGGGDGPMVAVSLLPSAVLGKVAGKIKGHDVGTVGAGLRGVVELYPWFLDVRLHERASVGRWLASAFGIWIGVRHDWADPERGGALAGGISVDVSRALLAPLLAR